MYYIGSTYNQCCCFFPIVNYKLTIMFRDNNYKY